MHALMSLLESDPHIVRTDDLVRTVAPDVLAAARRAGILRPEDPGFEDLSASDLARVLRVLYGLSGRGRPVPAAFDASAAPLGWMGTDAGAREVLLCARPESGLAKALARKRPALVLVPAARHLTPDLRERHAPGAVVELEALEESLVVLGGRLVRRAHIAPDAPDTGARVVEPVQHSVRLVGLAKRWADVRFYRLDETTVRIDAGRRSIRCTHVDLGMAHDGTRVPTRAWEVLWELCEHGGYFRTRRLGGENATRQTLHRFSNDLQALFGIRGSCFHRYRSDCGWKSRFEARSDGVDEE
jgi:hypothetical protein